MPASDSKPLVDEVFALRAISCIAIVLYHAVTALPQHRLAVTVFDEYLRHLLLFATPAFVIISELVLSYSDRGPLDVGRFLRQRLRYVFLPYAFWAAADELYATLHDGTGLLHWLGASLRSIALGLNDGYFVLIIFQFYLLHLLLRSRLGKWPIPLVLGLSLAINLAWLGGFAYTEPPSEDWGYFWSRGYWMFFPGWLFYFCAAFYLGKHVEAARRRLLGLRWRWLLAVFALCAPLLWWRNVRHDALHLPISSKTPDNLLYTFLVLAILARWITAWRYTPHLLALASRYSFAVYLIHIPFLLLGLQALDSPWINLPLWLEVTVDAAFALACSLAAAALLGRWRWSWPLLGRPGPWPGNLAAPRRP